LSKNDVTAAASYLFAAVAAAGDIGLAEDTYRAIAAVLPFHLIDDLAEAWNSLEIA
jgi:hypothetical protein